MNGVVEATNKNIKKILVKMIDTYKDWHEYRCDLVFISAWHGGRPPHRGKDPVFQDFVLDNAIIS